MSLNESSSVSGVDMMTNDAKSQKHEVGLLLLHPLPLDGSMWADYMDLIPGSTVAPTLYDLGDSIEEWAAESLLLTTADKLIVVGCSVGGSCAIEVAATAPERVAALVLVGTKAGHRPDPTLHAAAVNNSFPPTRNQWLS